MSALRELGDAQYINLETFRKNGTGVQTPVWVAPLGQELVIFTNGESYKVKRLKRNAKVRIAECGVRGGLKGAWHDGQGHVVDDEPLKNAAIDALHKKYGWQMKLADWGGRLAGTKKNWAVLAIKLGADRAA